jgi:hypothetical protein
MLLKELGFSKPTKKIDTINKFLKENYGVTVNNLGEEEALKMKKSLNETIVNMKRNNLSPTDPTFAKTLLMVGAVDAILENIYHERPHNVYRKVVGHLYDTAVKLINVGDEVDDAVATVMREYRSSPYRFPDSEVEFDLRNRLDGYMSSMEESTTAGSVAGVAMPLGGEIDEEGDQVFELEPEDEMSDAVEMWFCDDCMLGRANDDFTGIDDEDRYEEVKSCVYSLPPSVSMGDKEDDLSIRACDCCGTNLAGRRYQFWDLGSDDQTDLI